MRTVAAAVGTKRFAVVGSPIAHSRSPQIFAALAEITGVALAYERLEIAPENFARVVAGGRRRYDGWNVTAPHKHAALAAADEVTDDARVVGAANVLTFIAGRVGAANTDVAGVIALLQSHGIDPRGKAAMVLGAGGAGRATVLALSRLGAERVVVANRTPDRALALVTDLQAACGATQLIADVAATPAPIVINATSDGGAVASAVYACSPGGWCVDLQYKPAVTPFVRAAREAGHHAVNGSAMLVAQAIATFRIWFGEEVALDAGAATRTLTAIVEAP